MGVVVYSDIENPVMPLLNRAYEGGCRNMTMNEITSDSVLRDEMVQRNNRCLFVQNEESFALLDLIVRLAARHSTNGEYAILCVKPQQGASDLSAFAMNMGLPIFGLSQFDAALVWLRES